MENPEIMALFRERIELRLREVVAEQQAAQHGESPMVALVLSQYGELLEDARQLHDGESVLLAATIVAAIDMFQMLRDE